MAQGSRLMARGSWAGPRAEGAGPRPIASHGKVVWDLSATGLGEDWVQVVWVKIGWRLGAGLPVVWDWSAMVYDRFVIGSGFIRKRFKRAARVIRHLPRTPFALPLHDTSLFPNCQKCLKMIPDDSWIDPRLANKISKHAGKISQHLVGL